MRHLAYSVRYSVNPLNAELNPICHLLALVGAHHIVHVSWVRVNTNRFLPVNHNTILFGYNDVRL